MAKVHVSTTINGEPMEFLCEPYETMLDALRGQLGLTGSKEGCSSGDCGRAVTNTCWNASIMSWITTTTTIRPPPKLRSPEMLASLTS